METSFINGNGDVSYKSITSTRFSELLQYLQFSKTILVLKRRLQLPSNGTETLAMSGIK